MWGESMTSKKVRQSPRISRAKERGIHAEQNQAALDLQLAQFQYRKEQDAKREQAQQEQQAKAQTAKAEQNRQEQINRNKKIVTTTVSGAVGTAGKVASSIPTPDVNKALHGGGSKYGVLFLFLIILLWLAILPVTDSSGNKSTRLSLMFQAMLGKVTIQG